MSSLKYRRKNRRGGRRIPVPDSVHIEEQLAPDVSTNEDVFHSLVLDEEVEAIRGYTESLDADWGNIPVNRAA